MTVFTVHHSYSRDGLTLSKYIGVFGDFDAAHGAIESLRLAPGFREWPAGFVIHAYEVDSYRWDPSRMFYDGKR